MDIASVVRGSLKTRLFVWFLILSLVPTIVISMLAFFNSRSSLESTYLSALHTYASSQAESISKWVEENIRQLQLVASAPGIRTLKDEEIMRRIKEYVKINPAWEMMFWADINGMSHNTTDAWADIKDREYFQKVISTGQPVVSNGMISRATGRPIVVIAVPIFRNDGKIGGILGVTVTLDYLSQLCKNSKLMSQNGYGFIIQSDGLALAFPDESQILKANFLQTDSESVNAITKKMISGEDGVGRCVYNGVTQLVAYAPIKGTSWSFGVQEPAAEAFSASSNLMRFIIVIILISVAIILFVAYLIGNSIANPIVELTNTADIIAKGDLTVSIKGNYHGEIGRLARSLEVMLDNLKALIMSAKEVSNQTTSTGEQITGAVNQTTQAVQQVATTVQELANGAQETAKNVQEVSSAIDSIGSMIETLAQNASAVERINQETAKMTEEGQVVVNELNRGFNETQNVTNAVVSAMDELERLAGEIGRIVETITAISSQTNLLALNAAIEAARAGEAGRGFAVVADEVRKLAEESNQSAQRISQFIDEIRNQVVKTAENIKNSVSVVNRQIEIGSRVTETFNRITEGTGRVIGAIEEITKGISRLVDESRRISNSIQSVAAIAEENAASAEETSAASQEISAAMEEINANINNLLSLAKDLEELLGRFKV
ncbi:methyl-accepting chemotaxis protein [bacterium]|nr:methyl-accepting chemotaxis protein [bacterium]